MKTLNTYSEVKEEFVRRGYNETLSADFFAQMAWAVAQGQTPSDKGIEEASKKDVAEVAKMIVGLPN